MNSMKNIKKNYFIKTLEISKTLEIVDEDFLSVMVKKRESLDEKWGDALNILPVAQRSKCFRRGNLAGVFLFLC